MVTHGALGRSEAQPTPTHPRGDEVRAKDETTAITEETRRLIRLGAELAGSQALLAAALDVGPRTPSAWLRTTSRMPTETLAKLHDLIREGGWQHGRVPKRHVVHGGSDDMWVAVDDDVREVVRYAARLYHTQVALAGALGVSSSTVCDWLGRTVRMRLSTARAIDAAIKRAEENPPPKPVMEGHGGYREGAGRRGRQAPGLPVKRRTPLQRRVMSAVALRGLGEFCAVTGRDEDVLRLYLETEGSPDLEGLAQAVSVFRDHYQRLEDEAAGRFALAA